MHRLIALLSAAVFLSGPITAQQKTKPSEPLGKLELSLEVATTDDDGYPSAIRITVKNVGGVAVQMPVLKEDCSPDNGVHVHSWWTPDIQSDHGTGEGYGCATSDQPSVLFRAQHEWVRLGPGEYMTNTERLTWTYYAKDAPGTLEYWAEYNPPDATPAEVAELQQQGYTIPTEKLESQHSSFHIR